MKRYDISRLPKSVFPMFLLPRFNVVIGNFKRESFAVLTAFRSDRGLDDNLVAQSALVDRVKSAGLGWFPLYWDWG
ncbi:hypothetical protein JXD38_05025, partial [candidate division WOR-3 bacterium]|nr:hypothetical protein [candidate division WOR-3 bacterium]